MSRTIRRRLLVLGAVTLVGAGSPAWGPAVLRTIPAFNAAGIDVTGARFVGEEKARSLAAIPPGTSIWDDHSDAKARLESHPLIEEARIRRQGFSRLRLELREVKPIALVSAPALEPVDGRGELLPIDPSQHALDLPVLLGASVNGGRVTEENARRSLAVLDRLERLSPDFVHQVSEVHPARGDAVELRLLQGSHVERLLLPLEEAELAFLRAENAIRACAERGQVQTVDARFRDQIVVELRGKA